MTTTRISTRRLLAVVAAGTIFLAACGSDTDVTETGAGIDTGSDAPTATTRAHGGDNHGGTATAGPCPKDARLDAAYAVEVSGTLVSSTEMTLRVTRDGEPVTGATVCMVADMTGMSHAGISESAEEVSGGDYKLATRFGMRGRWDGEVIVVDGDNAVLVPDVTFEVE